MYTRSRRPTDTRLLLYYCMHECQRPGLRCASGCGYTTISPLFKFRLSREDEYGMTMTINRHDARSRSIWSTIYTNVT